MSPIRQFHGLPVLFLLLSAPLALHAQSTADCLEAPDLILTGGAVVTMDKARPRAEALAVRGDSLLAVGSDDEVRAALVPGCATRMVDLGGRAVLPGFNDAHSHWFSWPEHICAQTAETTYPEVESLMPMLSAHGWTSISELNFGRPDWAPDHLNNALDFSARGRLSVRVNGYWGTLDDGSLLDVLADSGRTPDTHYADRVRARGVKMYVDGPFGTEDLLSQEETTTLVRAAHERGWQVAAHAVNESGVEKILTAYEAVLGEASNEAYRHRIEHAVKVTDDQLDRMKAKGIIASFQLLGPSDWPAQETFQTYISNTRPDWALRWKDFVEARPEGLRVAGSTDAPFNEAPCDPSPFRAVHQAVTRRGYLDREHADWELAQRLSVEESIQLLTLDAAYATFEEDDKGSLAPGKWADFVVVSRDPLAVDDPDELLGIDVLLTVVGGRVEYCDGEAGGDLCGPAELFRMGPDLVGASAYLPGQTPDRAFDGDPETVWSAGDYPPQSIQITFGESVRLDRVELVVDQWPPGRTVHELQALGEEPDATFEVLEVFDGDTEPGQLLRYTAPADLGAVRALRVESLESPSWVAWQEIRVFGQTPTPVESEMPGRAYGMTASYPNPFGASTTVAFDLARPGGITLAVFDVLGREVAVLASGHHAAGRHEVVWNAAGHARGVYLLRLDADDFHETRKLILQVTKVE